MEQGPSKKLARDLASSVQCWAGQPGSLLSLPVEKSRDRLTYRIGAAVGPVTCRQRTMIVENMSRDCTTAHQQSLGSAPGKSKGAPAFRY